MHFQLDYRDIVPRQATGTTAVNSPALAGTTSVAVTDAVTILSGLSVGTDVRPVHCAV